MLLFWGPERVQICNDASLPIFGDDRHPAAMGQRARDSWASCQDAWSFIGPRIDEVMLHARPSAYEDRYDPILRNGRIEESYWSYSFCPAFEEDGTVGGALVLCTETTGRVVSDRRERTLRTFADRIANVTTTSELLPVALEVLRDETDDVPFAIDYTLGRDGKSTPRRTTLDGDRSDMLRDVHAAVRSHVEATRTARAPLTACRITFPPVQRSDAPWPEPVTEALVMPLSTNTGEPRALLVFGLNPRAAFDRAYRDHLEQLVARMAQAHSRIEAIEVRANTESERRNLLLQARLATVLTTGPEHVIELANSAFTEIVRRDVVGKRLVEAFPELANTDLHRTFDHVYLTGQPVGTPETLFQIRRGNTLEERWLQFHVQTLRDGEGDVYGMMGIVLDLTDAISARREIEKYSEEREKLLTTVEAASRSKDEFLAMLGHELRNPLAPITTALHLMKLKAPGALVREREIIERQSAHLVKLVDDLLDVARVARGKVTLNKTRLVLAEVLARAVETASPLFEQKQHVLALDSDGAGSDIHVEGDALRLAQVFANLLTNAAKYTPTRGRISVHVRRDHEFALVRIEDNGIGIPPEQIPHLFDTFFQGPQTPDRAQGGLGLGLALVKSFVTLHGGSVTASSGGVGTGSIFEVRLPALPRAEASYTMRDESAPMIPEGRRVLLVDDSQDILEIVSSLLRYEGYEVMSALDGPTALNVITSFEPDVAVVDIGLPAMDGYELAQLLRATLKEKTPKLIAMTGYGQDADRERAREAGFAAHLVKPADPSELLASIADSSTEWTAH